MNKANASPMLRAGGAILAAALVAVGCGERTELVEVPAGSSFVVTLSQPLSTSGSEAGDSFEARVEQPLIVHAEPVIEVGTTVRGELTSVVSGANGLSTPSLTLVFKEVVEADGTVHPVQARPLVVAGTEPEPADAGETADEAGSVTGDDPAPDAPSEDSSMEESDATMAEPGLPTTTLDTGPMLAAGSGPVMVPAASGDIMLPSGQEVRVELAAAARLPL